MSAVSIMEPMIAIATIDARHIPDSARRIATFSLFDWMVVTRAGRIRRIEVFDPADAERALTRFAELSASLP